MRQVGVLAAAARVALERGVDRLAEDHANARRLAEGLADLDPASVDPESVETNMVYVDLSPFGREASEVAELLAPEGVVTLGGAGPTMRLVTHKDVPADGIERALEAFKRVL
jgi:threonine aldolase